VETIGSKRSYALIWCMPNNDDDDDDTVIVLFALATIHSVTDRRTDSIMPIANHATCSVIGLKADNKS